MNFFTPPAFEDDEDKSLAAGTLYRILIVSYVLIPMSALIPISDAYKGRLYLPVIFGAIALVTFFLAMTRRGYIRATSVALILSFLILSTVIDVSSNGETRPVTMLAAAHILAAGLLLGLPGLFITTLAIGIEHFLVLYLVHGGLITFTNTIPAPTPAANGAITFAIYILIAMLFSLASRNAYLALARARQSERELAASNQQLQELTQDLEQRISERMGELSRANEDAQKGVNKFRAITEVTRAISVKQKLQDLLPEITTVISEQFGFYHVGLFLIDSSNQYAILSATNSEGGKTMLARGHKLAIGELGAVGYVTQSGRPQVALDADTKYFNSALPLTRSEMALPLKMGRQIIGVLDVQSTEANAFIDQDIDILSILAEQVSLAIQNARLFDRTEKTLAEADVIQRQYIRETWSRLPKEEKLSGFRYSVAGAVQLLGGETATTDEDIKDKREVSVPIILRGETIGTLSVQVPKSEHVATDQMDLIKAVAERVALSAENARLFGETTRRAERERIISDIASKIGTSVRTESILRTTATELSQLLEDADIFINLQVTKDKKDAE
jgi:GAF domain-containing protein